MPKAYQKMKEKFMAEGMSEAAAEKKAARIYNAKKKKGKKKAVPTKTGYPEEGHEMVFPPRGGAMKAKVTP